MSGARVTAVADRAMPRGVPGTGSPGGARLRPIGAFRPGATAPRFEREGIEEAARLPRRTVHVVRDPATARVGVALEGRPCPDEQGGLEWLATLPALHPEWLGSREFVDTHGLRFAYVAGAMANGIATVPLVEAMARTGALGFFGAAGLAPDAVERGVVALGRALDGDALPWGSNLIHSPQEPALEEAVVDCYLAHGVRRVSASAYMDLTPAVVRYAVSGLSEAPDGSVVRARHLFAKVSRPEVARRFAEPAPAALLDELRRRGAITAREAALAARVPLAEDLIVESDSGGHTDNRPLGALFPIILHLARDVAARHTYLRPLRVGAAGGLGTPAAVATAFGLGAAFVLTGSINQACVESGLSDAGKAALAEVGLADVMMAPAADMFEMGVDVQVMRRGTLFGPRARRLYELYRRHDGLEAIPAAERGRLEGEILGAPVEEVWGECERFFAARAPEELDRAAGDPKHRMALVFRWYLGLSSRWAIDGAVDRRLDFQIWCGPAMGAFNDWTRGTFLEAPRERRVGQVALNLLEGAAAITRAQQLRTYGVPVPDGAFAFAPRRLSTT